MYRYIFMTVLLVLSTLTVSAQQYVVTQTIPSSGTANVPLNTTLSVTFDAEVDMDPRTSYWEIGVFATIYGDEGTSFEEMTLVINAFVSSIDNLLTLYI
jgi:hypothetical protein